MALPLFVSTLFCDPSYANQKTVIYKNGGQEFEGIFFSSGQKNAPGIVLIHNWMGVTSESEKQAKRFQALGYNVFVADIYGKGIRPKDSNEAGSLAGKYKSDRKLLRERFYLALHGADDPYVPAKDIEAFESEMKSHKVSYEIVSYPGAVHSFTDMGAGNDNSKGAAYNATADSKSFEKATEFLKLNL